MTFDLNHAKSRKDKKEGQEVTAVSDQHSGLKCSESRTCSRTKENRELGRGEESKDKK